MLTIHQISKSFGVDSLLDSVTFHLNPGERAGLVGPNGSGKTTLLRIIAGLDRPDSGSVRFNPPDLRVGYLAQGLAPGPDDTLASFLARATGDPQALTAEVEQLAARLARSPDDASAQQLYDLALARLTAAHENQSRTPAVMAALGLDRFSPKSPAAALSGGQKTRLGLAGVLLGDPHLLLLDEPTNHLDIEMLQWLEDWLSQFRGGVLLVSHDRAFLDAACDRILELDPATRAVQEYPGNYTDYIEQKIAERERHWSRWRDQEAEVRRMKQDIARTREQALGVERSTTPRQPGVRRYAKKVARKALSREKKLGRYLESDERVEKPRSDWQMKLDFGQAPGGSRDVLVLEQLSVGYGAQTLLAGLDARLRFGARAVLTGPNGSGKTTLLRTIAGLLPPQAGRVRLGASVRAGYMAQEHEGLNPHLNAVETIRGLAASMSDTDVRTFLHLFLFGGDDVFTPVGALSYGERARLLLAGLVARGCNFLLLDEPINHLDIPSRARFEEALNAFEGTILTVVHDRYFIATFASEVWQLEDGRLTIETAGP
jgi:ATP-binding cassette subfamily F protein 3